MLYSDFTAEIGALVPVPLSVAGAASAAPFSVADYNTHLPRAIEYAELRMYTELDLLNTRVTDNTANLAQSNRKFMLPSGQGTFIVTEEISVIVNGVAGPPLTPVSKEFLDAVYPSNVPVGLPSVPVYWCPVDQVSVLVGPAPDQAYGASVFGTIRPTPLSSTNAQTFLTQFLADAFVAAAMVSFSGLIRDYGAQSDDPQRAVSWEAIYKERIGAYSVEESRKRYRSVGTGNRIPSPVQTPPQT